jgi:hypothetical protein
MIEKLLPLNQQKIIKRASARIKKQYRRDFIKFVEDVLRAQRDPPDDTTVRHACGSGILRYGRKL